MQVSSQIDYDLVIVGGGAAGLSFLLGLEEYFANGFIRKVLLIEKEANFKPIPGRSIALNQHTLEYYNNLKFTHADQHFTALNFLSDKLYPIHNILIKNQDYSQQLLLKANEHFLDQFGGVVDLIQLQNQLEKLVNYLQVSYPDVNIDILHGCQVLSCHAYSQDNSFIRKLTIKYLPSNIEYQLTCNLVIVANGATFITGLERYAFNLHKIEHKQYGIIADVTFNQPHNQLAIEYFTENGPIAFLPTGAKQAVVVCCVPEKEYKSIQEQPQLLLKHLQLVLNDINTKNLLKVIPQQWKGSEQTTLLENIVSKEAINTLSVSKQIRGEFANYITSYSNISSYVLNAQMVTKLYDVNLAYLGNAAHTLHPVSGQGFNLAVIGVKNLLQAIKQIHKEYSNFTFAQSVNLIVETYHNLHYPVAKEAFERTNFLAKEFTSQAYFGKIVPNLGLYHLIAYPFLQDLIVTPSLGYPKINKPSLTYKLLQFVQALNN